MKRYACLLWILLWVQTSAWSQDWNALYSKGKDAAAKKDYKNALLLLQQAEQAAQKQFGQNHPSYRSILMTLGETYNQTGEYNQGLTCYILIAKILKESKQSNTAEYADVLHDMAATYEQLKQPGRALSTWEECANIRLKVLGEKSPVYGTTLMELADLYTRAKNTAKADETYDKLYKMKPVFATKQGDWRNILQQYAAYQQSNKRYDKAIALYQEYIKSAETAKIKKAEYMQIYASLAQVQLETGDITGADKNMQVYLSAFSDITTEGSVNYAKELDEAIKNFRKAATANAKAANDAQPVIMRMLQERTRVQKQLTSEASPEYIALLMEYGTALKEAAKYPEAKTQIQQAISLQKALPNGEQSPSYANALDLLGRLQWRTNNPTEAEATFRQALSLREKHLTKEHPDYSKALDSLGYFCLAQNREADAESLFKEAMDIRAKKPGKKHPDYAASLANLSNLYLKQSKLAQAEPLLKEEGSINSVYHGSVSEPYAQTLKRLADVYKAQGKDKEALNQYLQVKTMFEKVGATTQPAYAETQKSIAELQGKLK